jgi:hypothetical protein
MQTNGEIFLQEEIRGYAEQIDVLKEIRDMEIQRIIQRNHITEGLLPPGENDDVPRTLQVIISVLNSINKSTMNEIVRLNAETHRLTVQREQRVLQLHHSQPDHDASDLSTLLDENHLHDK